MTAMNFPLDPSDGDIHDNYVYDATHGVWNANPQQIISRFISSDTAPTNPSAGDGWFDSETGKTYIYHDSSWVESGNPVIGFVDPYDQDSTSTGYFSMPKGTDAQRPINPSNGDMRFNTESGEPEWYSEAESAWFLFSDGVPSPVSVSYLLVAGGGSGGKTDAGGGGAGGYIQGTTVISPGTNYTISVGGGAPAQTGGALWLRGNSGTDSAGFGLVADGGSGGATGGGGTTTERTSLPGGSTGGAGSNGTSLSFVGTATVGQGFRGGIGASSQGGGGGGGAATVGESAPASTTAGDGGVGREWINGTYYAGGGGGGHGTPGTGGLGGGGNGTNTVGGIGTPGQINTGGGGGGGGSGYGDGAAGGSGVVAVKYPVTTQLSVGSGLIYNTQVSGDGLYNYTYFTAGTDTITFS